MDNSNTFLKVVSEDIKEAVFLNVSINNNIDDILYDIEELHKIKGNSDSIIVSLIDTFEKETVRYEGLDSHEQVKKVYRNVKKLNNDDEEIKLGIVIYKTPIESVISIYSLESFKKYLTNNDSSVTNILSTFENLYKSNNVKFNLILDKGYINTPLFSFSNKSNNQEHTDIEYKRKDLYKNMYENCHLVSETPELVPNDFNVTKCTENNSFFKDVFDLCKNIYSIIFISNLTKLENEELYYQIEGYKTIKKTVKLNSVTNNNLFNIFDWTYSSNDNFTERIEMVRNIITLHLQSDNILDIEEEVLSSIKSGYKIYLKENVDNYIDVLNQVVVLLNQLEQEALKVADTFIVSFKGSLTSMVTFFITTILFSTISNGTLTNIFTPDIMRISLGFLLISLFYFIFSLTQYNLSMNQLNEVLERNKKQYGVILNTEDLNRIFNLNTRSKDENKIEYLKKNRCIVSALWIITLLVLVIIVIWCSMNYTPPTTS